MDTINDNPIEILDEDIADVPALPTEPAEGQDGIDWEAEAKKFQGMATRRGTALKKAKDFLGKKPPEKQPAEVVAQDPKKGELDYGQKAYLNSLGYKDAEDQTYVQDIMKNTGKSLEEVLATPFVSAELKRLGEERATKAAAPAAEDGRQGAPARDTVEYWLAKGELPPADQIELRRKFVNAKVAKERNGGMFSATPVVGQG